jgi:hypothetical protein
MKTTTMNTKKAVFTVPVASTDFTREAFLDCSGLAPVIRYSYESDSGQCSSGIKFLKVAAFRKRGERCCAAWHIEGAYDTLVEIEGSAWVAELKADVAKPYQDEWQPRHYMIYLDSVGCFEFLAESWEALPDTPSQPLA